MHRKKFLNIFFIFSLSFLLANCFSKDPKKSTTKQAAPHLHTVDVKFDSLAPEVSTAYSSAVEEFYNQHLEKGFNGAILVAKNGQILFEQYKGYANFITKDPITEHTPFHLASISKTFTGMAVLKLWEEGKLSLDDTLQKYFPTLPYYGITIRMLLSHRSGLPNYLYFMDSLWDKHKEMTNEDVLNAMIAHHPAIHSEPDKHFEYCNTNFMLLALIVEKITGEYFPDYMKQNVFAPLGMNDTYIFSIKDTANYIPTWSVSKPFPMDPYDCTYGDKNVYSTVRDLFTWDKALYQHTFLKKSTLDMAFTPTSNEHRSKHNYGLAWRLFINNGDTVVYHNGKWHGTNTSFIRLVQDTATIIVLGNKQNSNIYHAKDMEAIFRGKAEMDKLDE
ncbi:MAG TPA: serine hydrolase domain-containing protein [Parafilimonas sp.]|nr:serine hydrolase domain-containing protein [Parafilimonas sp.]